MNSGPPSVIKTDGGPEFMKDFIEDCNQHAIFHHVTDAHAPWQNGRTERKGGFIKRQVYRTTVAIGGIQTRREQKMVVHECVLASNRFFNRSGFSPMQRVFGFTLRMPRTLTSDDPVDPYEMPLDARDD